MQRGHFACSEQAMTFVEFAQLFGVGGSAGAAVAWLGREWISTRLKQAIEYEYSAKLEAVRNDFNLRVQELTHQNEVARLRTSLFFDHQRNAFAEILVQVEAVNHRWLNESFDAERYEWQSPVPYEGYRALRDLCVKHQLFLDVDSTMALDVLFSAWAESFADEGGDGGINEDACRDSYGRARYVQRRITGLFQQQIGIDSQQQALLEIALLGSVMRINTFSSSSIPRLPTDSPLLLIPYRSADDVVTSARAQIDEVRQILAAFMTVLQGRGDFQDEVAQAGRFLAVFQRFSL